MREQDTSDHKYTISCVISLRMKKKLAVLPEERMVINTAPPQVLACLFRGQLESICAVIILTNGEIKKEKYGCNLQSTSPYKISLLNFRD